MATPAAILSILVQAEGIGRVSSNVRGLDRDLERTSKRGVKHLGLLKGAAAGLGAFAAFEVLKKSVGLAVSEFQEARKVGAQTTAVLKSTGGAANVTAKQITNMSNALSKKAGIDDEAIQKGENLLLTFRQVRNETGKGNDIFNQATAAMTDMSVAMGQDMKSSAIQLGKALNDPVKGITALRRVGVTFTAQQTDQIKKLAQSGHQLEAQKMIIAELNKEFGGSAAAAATPMDKLKVSVGNLAEAAGGVMAPALDKAATFLTKLMDGMSNGTGVGGAFVGVLKTIGSTLANVVGFFQRNHQMVVVLAGAIAGALIPSVYGLVTALGAMAAAFVANPVVLVTVALAAFGAAVVLAYQRSATFRSVVGAVFGWLPGAATAAVGAAVVAFAALRTGFQATGALFTTVTHTVVGEISQWDALFSAIGRGVTLMVAIVKVQLDALKIAFRVGMLALAPIAVAAWTLVKGIFSAYLAAIKGIVTGGLQVIRGVIKVFGGLFKGDFGQMWDGVKTIFSGGIKALKGILDGAWKILKAPVDAIGAGMHDAFSHSWDRIKDVFKSSINAVIDFLNVLIRAVNSIPGVPDIKPIGSVGGGGGGGNRPAQKNLGGTGHLAKGGSWGRGGMVNAPTVIMGEEAPRWPEFVIPTNPQYRSRAQGLLGQAASTIGLAEGGVVSAFKDVIHQTHANPKAALALFEAGIVESGLRNLSYGDRDSRGALQVRDSTAASMGLNNMDPGSVARAFMTRGFWGKGGAIALSAIYSTAGQVAQNVQGSAFPGRYDAVAAEARKYLGGGGGGFSIGDALGGLPKVTDKLGIFKGLGEYVLAKAGAYIKDQASKVTDVFTGGPSAGSKNASGISLKILDAIRFAQTRGFAYPSPGQLTGGGHAKGSFHYQGRAVDFGAAGHSGGQMMGLFNALFDKYGLGINEMFYDPAGRYIDAHRWVQGAIGGHSDHLHLAFRRGGRRGGMPYLGSFRRGGITGREGMAHLHANEAVLPLKKGAKRGKQTVNRSGFSSSQSRKRAGVRFELPKYGPAKGNPIGYVSPTTGTGDDGGISAGEQALIDAQEAAAAASREATEAANRLADLVAQQNANQLKIIALTRQGPEILAAVVAAVNGGIGGKVGLGFQSPSYAGGVARYS